MATTKTITFYSFDELSENAKKKAIQTETHDRYGDSEYMEGTAGELLDTAKAIAEAFDLKLEDWSLGAHNRHNFFKVDCDLDKHDSRVWFGKVMQEIGYGFIPKFDGSCLLTGVGFDDDLLEAMYESLRSGDANLRQAFDAAAAKAGKILSEEQDHYASEEVVIESLEGRGDMFQSSGEQGL